MFITRIKLKNWRNFRTLEVPLRAVTYVLGPNASGKSNLLDVFRFLRDICNPRGGGLQTAVSDRDGIAKLRCLHARRDPEVRIEVQLAESPDGPPYWRYELGFKPEGKGRSAFWFRGRRYGANPSCFWTDQILKTRRI